MDQPKPQTVQQPSPQRGASTSASNAAADALCPGRHLAQAQFPEEEKTGDAVYGTRVHDALAAQKPTMLTAEQENVYEACNAITEKVLPVFFGDEIKNLLAIPNREKRFWIKWADGLMHSGQIDAVYRKGTKALIVEYKTLNGDQQESSRNAQLRDQAVLFDFNCPLLTEIGVVVVQPLVTHSPELCVYKREHILQARDQLYARVKASNDPNSPRVAGELQCKFCRAKNGCPEYNAWAGQEVASAAGSESLIDKPISMWTPAERAMFLERAVIVGKWIENCKDEMKRILKADPNAIPGYTLKPGNNMTTILNPQEVFNTFSKEGGTLDKFMECVAVTKTKLTEAVRAVTKLKGKKLEDAVEAIIGPNFTSRQNDSSIVKADK